MAGIEAGKTWSRIGAEVAPTSSAASGVWGDLNEVAENVGAGTWPTPPDDWEFIAKFVGDGTTASYDFTSIPQTYRDLRFVGSLARNSGSAGRVYFEIDVGSGIDTTASNYGFLQIKGASSNYGAFSVSNSYGGYPGFYGDWPSGSATKQANSFFMDFHDYANSSKIPNAMLFQNSFKAGTQSFLTSHGGWMYDPTGAIQGLRVTCETTTSAYYYKEPTTFALFGRGTAD
tara:strand:- start:1160 stop:1849 length:690 start_codon:yes stop_codon:yes gene_type:complete